MECCIPTSEICTAAMLALSAMENWELWICFHRCGIWITIFINIRVLWVTHTRTRTVRAYEQSARCAEYETTVMADSCFDESVVVARRKQEMGAVWYKKKHSYKVRDVGGTRNKIFLLSTQRGNNLWRMAHKLILEPQEDCAVTHSTCEAHLNNV
jgi:hypothetical protein